MTATTAANRSAQQRAAAGKDARSKAPRSSHRSWQSPTDRRTALDILREQDATRVPELVPVRHGRMLVSPFTFFRGAAAVMAEDLAGTTCSGLEVQLCGDAHLSNFGVFAAPDRSLVFDCNDFDETLPGPFEWDVKRLAASFAIAGRDRDFRRRERRAAVLASVGEYHEAMRTFATMSDLDVWYSRLDVSAVLARLGPKLKDRRRQQIERSLAKAQHKDSLRALRKLTQRVNGAPRIASDPPLITPIE